MKERQLHLGNQSVLIMRYKYGKLKEDKCAVYQQRVAKGRYLLIHVNNAIFFPAVDYSKTSLLPSCVQMRYYHRLAVQSPRMEETCRLLLETLLPKCNKVNQINKVGLLW